MDENFPQARSCKKQETHSVSFPSSKWLLSSAFSAFYILSRIYHCYLWKVCPIEATQPLSEAESYIYFLKQSQNAISILKLKCQTTQQ